MKQIERKLYNTLKSYIGNDVFLTRIENTVTPGIPDLVGIANGVIVLIELKVINKGKVELQPSQSAFMQKSLKRGFKPCIIACNELQTEIVVARIDTDVTPPELLRGMHVYELSGVTFDYKDKFNLHKYLLSEVFKNGR